MSARFSVMLTALVVWLAAPAVFLYSADAQAQSDPSVNPLAELASDVARRRTDALVGDSWIEIASDNFHLVSQLPEAETGRLADRLEQWLQAAAALSGIGQLRTDLAVDNYIYVFDNEEQFQHFENENSAAPFHATPRANFFALLIDSDADQHRTLTLARHHFYHFLVHNSQMDLPRWYHEGLAAYVAGLQVENNTVRVRPPDSDVLEVSLRLINEVPLQTLLYHEDALLSPRLIQIANSSSASFLYFLLHGHEYGHIERRNQLQSYLSLLAEGRSGRYAFDRSFDATLSDLDDEYQEFLRARLSEPENARLLETSAQEAATEPPASVVTGRELSSHRVAILLGELALHAGRFEIAESLFDFALEESGGARAHSGVADARRMQSFGEPVAESAEEGLIELYRQAVQIDPNDPYILLDYGEYLEAELTDCQRSYSQQERAEMMDAIKDSYERALALAPDSPEAHLAYAQFYLLPGQSWEEGVESQRRAYSLLPAEPFVAEQAIRYAIADAQFEQAEERIDDLSKSLQLHFWGEPFWITDLRERLDSGRRGAVYSPCSEPEADSRQALVDHS